MYSQETDIPTDKIKRTTKYCLFSPDSGTREAHVLLKSEPGLTTEKAWESVISQLEKTEEQLGFSANSRLFLRIFLSDASNQELILRQAFPDFFDEANSVWISFVQQPPMPYSKIALWAYLVDGESNIEKSNFGQIFRSNGYTHIWTANLMGDHSLNTFGQTEGMFLNYIQTLENLHSNLSLNAIRTWIFVRDVDVMYPDVVKARKLVFEKYGLTDSTHFISSTGIEGRNRHSNCHSFMDTYSVAGIKPTQIQFLKAPEFLSPTSKYGVTFERGTAIQYGDRKHVFISGTASIDKEGEIVDPEDVEKQVLRIIVNIKALLEDASCSLSNIAMALVYIRDIADCIMVKSAVHRFLPDIPMLILLAPVCRPAWLVEIEVIALCEERSTFKDY